LSTGFHIEIGNLSASSYTILIDASGLSSAGSADEISIGGTAKFIKAAGTMWYGYGDLV